MLKGKLKAAGVAGVHVRLTGAPAMWSDFNEANKQAMMRSELLSWPVTLAILAVAFGSLVAAGLPLMLTILGLMAAAGSLFVAGQFVDVSIWAMNFALMFALALFDRLRRACGTRGHHGDAGCKGGAHVVRCHDRPCAPPSRPVM